MDTTTIPCTIDAAADARVAELGMQSAFEQMLGYVHQAVPRLRAIEVTCDSEEPEVIITVRRDYPGPTLDPVYQHWVEWLIESFSTDVGRHFLLMTIYEDGNAG